MVLGNLVIIFRLTLADGQPALTRWWKNQCLMTATDLQRTVRMMVCRNTRNNMARGNLQPDNGGDRKRTGATLLAPSLSRHLNTFVWPFKGRGMTGALSVTEELIPSIISTYSPHLTEYLLPPIVLRSREMNSSLSQVKFIYSHRSQFERSRLWRVVAGRLGRPGIVRGPELGVGHAVPHLGPRAAPGQGVAESVRTWGVRWWAGTGTLARPSPLVLWTTTFLLVSRNLSFWGLSLASTEARKLM